MADRVIIVGTKRARENVETSELKQMCGRAGRVHGSNEAFADIIVEESEIERVEVEMESDESLSVVSVMDNIENVMFHLIAEINNGSVSKISDVEEWYSRSFYAHCDGDVDLAEVLSKMLDYESIVINDEFVMASKLGEIASNLYFNPRDVYLWKENFRYVFEHGLECDDFCLIWALCDVPLFNYKVDLKGCYDVIDRFRGGIGSKFLEIDNGTLASGILCWSIIGGPSMGKFRNVKNEIVKNFGRIGKALSLINHYEKWNMSELFDELTIRFNYGIDSSLVDLCLIEGIGKSHARELYNIGVSNKEDFAKKMQEIGEIGDLSLLNRVKKMVNDG